MKPASALLFLLVCTLAACRSLAPLSVESTMFAEGGTIPDDYTCDGRNIMPPMAVTGVPAEAKALGVLMYDLDAEKEPALHLAMWNIDPTTVAWSEVDPPRGAIYGQNDAGMNGYSGPCRAIDKVHHYVFEVYAFDRALDLMSGAKREMIEETFSDNAIAKGALTGVYTGASEKTQPL